MQKALDKQEQMNLAIIGHVDHGKSTVLGRMLYETGSLSQDKVEKIHKECSQKAKVFEYAFLIDALKDEQSQGITIDMARCFLKTTKRRYMVIDTPGHIEFLKNMVTGVAKAQAALLVIDAKEGLQENSFRHGYLSSFLGIKQLLVVVNKMDLCQYSREVFEKIALSFNQFLKTVGIVPQAFIPVSGRCGDNILSLSTKMSWYKGLPLVEHMDAFSPELAPDEKPLRFPIQDIYKFTQKKDDRRIYAGTIETGSLSLGDEVVFMPSMKRSTVASFEAFSAPKKEQAFAGEAVGITLKKQVYVRSGEVLCLASGNQARVCRRFVANIFWFSPKKMCMQNRYLLRLGSQKLPVSFKTVERVMDATCLSLEAKQKEIRHNDVAECVLETSAPIALDLYGDISALGRFVIFKDYDIVAAGAVSKVFREKASIDVKQALLWDKGGVSLSQRMQSTGQVPAWIVFTGDRSFLAKNLEKELFKEGKQVLYLGTSRFELSRQDMLSQLALCADVLARAGMIIISHISCLANAELQLLETLCPTLSLHVLGEISDCPSSSEGIENEEDLMDRLQMIKETLAQESSFKKELKQTSSILV